MKAPSKAVVLAAGLGRRMWPLSVDTPKPLMPVWGTPILDRLLAMLGRWGVREVLMNLHSGAEAIVDHVRKRESRRPLVCFSFEPEIRGTGGALRRAEWFVDNGPFWLVNGDIVAELTPDPLVSAYARIAPLAVLWLTEETGPRTVEMSGNRVTRFRSPRAGSPGTYTLCGLHLVSPRILRDLPNAACRSIVEAYEAAIA